MINTIYTNIVLWTDNNICLPSHKTKPPRYHINKITFFFSLRVLLQYGDWKQGMRVPKPRMFGYCACACACARNALALSHLAKIGNNGWELQIRGTFAEICIEFLQLYTSIIWSDLMIWNKEYLGIFTAHQAVWAM